MKRLPVFTSLFSRILVALAAGVILAQVISATIWVTQWRADSEQRVREVSRHMAFRVSSTVQFFSSLPQAYRHVVLDQLRDMGGTRFFVTVNREFIELDDMANSNLKAVVLEEFHQALFQQLGTAEEEVHIAFTMPNDLKVLNNETYLKDLPSRWADLSLLQGSVQVPILALQLKVSDNEWLYLATMMPSAEFLADHWPLSAERIFSLVISLLTVLVFGFFIVQMLVRPLRELSNAAQRFGQGDMEPLEEHGSDEVVSATRAFNAMQDRIQRYLDDRERLFASISHDLKTPITRLRLRAEMLDNDKDRENFTRDLEDLDLMVKGALQSVKDTDIHENPVEVDVWRLLEGMVEGAELNKMSMTLKGQRPEPFRGKPLALKRALTNLVDNALYYGKAVEVVVEDSPEALVLKVKDRGPGIPEDKLESVFQPYTRLSPSRVTQLGMGLGLAISRNIIRAHGGEVILSNRSQGGLEALVTLPRGA